MIPQKIFVSLVLLHCSTSLKVGSTSLPQSSTVKSDKVSDLNFGTTNDELSTFEDAYGESRTFDKIHGESGGTSSDGGEHDEGGFGGGKKRRLVNTSIALTASFFSFYVPPRSHPGDTVDLANQAIYGLYGFLAVILIYAVPVLFTGIRETARKARSVSGFGDDEDNNESWITSSLMSVDQVQKIFNEEFRDDIGLDRKKCLQKIICEAHRSPKNKEYGLIALPFQMFYPPVKPGSSEGRASSFQESAAAIGKYGKEDCAKKYRCFFDALDLFTFLVDWYRLENDSEYTLKQFDEKTMS